MSPHTTAATTIRNQQYYEEPGGEEYGNVLRHCSYRKNSACEEFMQGESNVLMFLVNISLVKSNNLGTIYALLPEAKILA